MHKIMAIVFIVLLMLLAIPVYAGNGFQYTRLLQTDNLKGYKSVVLDKAVYAHSDHLNDLRLINDRDEEVPYILTSILDASTVTEKESFILSEDAQYSSTQDGTDSIITIQANHLNAFRLELNTDDITERTYGLFGVKDESTYYLSNGEILSLLPSDSSVNKDIEWSNTPPVDKLKLIIHNRDRKAITLKSINVKYYLTKLVFEDLGSSHYRLTYGDDTLRSPIYSVMKDKAIIKKGVITQSTLGPEILSPPETAPPKTSSTHKLLFIITLSTLISLLIIGFGLRWRTKN